MKFCDMLCKYAKLPSDNMDGSGSCQTFIAIFCEKKECIVFKNAPCNEKELENEDKL